MRRAKRAASLFAAAAILTLFLHTTEAAAQSAQHVVLLIERGTPMEVLTTGGVTRFRLAIQQAQNLVAQAPPYPRSFAVWTFAGSSYTVHQGFSNASVTMATLNSLTVGYGTTPLAHAVCGAVDALLSHQPTVLASKWLVLWAAGEENSTPSTSECAGPSSSTPYPNLTPGSWQWKVRNKLYTGNPNVPPSFPYPLVEAQFMFASPL